LRAPRLPAAPVAFALVALAVALRASRIANGLPEFVEEAAPFRWALAMFTTGFFVSNRILSAGDTLNTSAGSRRPDLSTITMLNQ